MFSWQVMQLMNANDCLGAFKEKEHCAQWSEGVSNYLKA